MQSTYAAGEPPEASGGKAEAGTGGSHFVDRLAHSRRRRAVEEEVARIRHSPLVADHIRRVFGDGIGSSRLGVAAAAAAAEEVAGHDPVGTPGGNPGRSPAHDPGERVPEEEAGCDRAAGSTDPCHMPAAVRSKDLCDRAAAAAVDAPRMAVPCGRWPRPGEAADWGEGQGNHSRLRVSRSHCSTAEVHDVAAGVDMHCWHRGHPEDRGHLEWGEGPRALLAAETLADGRLRLEAADIPRTPSPAAPPYPTRVGTSLRLPAFRLSRPALPSPGALFP
jgi:hypothetical protein